MGGSSEQQNVTATESTASLSVEAIEKAVYELKQNNIDIYSGTVGTFFGVSIVESIMGDDMAIDDSEFNERQAEISKEFQDAIKKVL